MAKKKTTSKKRKPTAAKVRDELILALVAGRPLEEVVALAVSRRGINESKARAMVEDAERAIAVAAGTDRVDELRRVLDQLDEIQRSAAGRVFDSAASKNVALNALRERAKLLGLYGRADDVVGGDADDPASAELAEIAGHLVPLGLAPEDYPLAGHARIAADHIRRSQKP